METKKLIEGGILSALQIVLGFALISTGIGYGLYLEIVLPITMALMFLRCGKKISMIAGINTLFMLTFGIGNLGLSVYAFQALGIGYLTAYILERKQDVLDDLLIGSLMGCIFVLVLDLLTATLLGYSLLDDDGITEMIMSLIPGANHSVVEIGYYLSIASIPMASVLFTYLGTIIVGYRLRIKQSVIKEKYYFIKYYKVLVPFSYQGKKVAHYIILGLIVNLGLWPYVTQPYLRAWIACSSVIIAYFSLMDLSKLIGQFILEHWRRPILLMAYHLLLLGGLFKAFKWTCLGIVIIGVIIDGTTGIREEQKKRLTHLMKRCIKGHFKSKNAAHQRIRIKSV